MKTKYMISATLAALLAGGLMISGCAKEEGPLEKAGEQADEAVEEAGEAVDDALDEAGDALEDLDE